MARLIAKLLILVAVLLMPIGMAPVAASATHHAAADMPMQHCPDQSPTHDMKGGLAECTMACAAALPAADLAPQARLMIVCQPLLPAGAEPLRGLHPDTATPPPKRS